jgi:hypothetical protein
MMRAATGVYKSSKQALAWFFEKSRHRWKGHCRILRRERHSMVVRVADATRVRDAWREKAEAAQCHAAVLEAQVDHWQAQYEIELKKTRLRLAGGRS